MQSATLTRLLPGTNGSARLRSLRTWKARDWARLGFAAMCLAALAGYLAFPTYPTYDTFYALLWGHDLVHLHLPDLSVYRAPTEHPLAIAFGAVCSLFGQEVGPRLMVLGAVASFVGAVGGMYRVGRLCWGELVGLVAALLLLTRFFVENLAAQGYLDVTYIALVVWALALEVARPRRGPAVLLMLAAAGLLRPDAWVLSGLYWLWCCWPSRWPPRADELARAARYLALALLAPAIWACFDWIVTGDPAHSLTATAELAQELERTHGFGAVLASVWSYSERIDHLAVVLGSLAGLAIALVISPRRSLIPLGALAGSYLAFLGEGAAGASQVDRYLMGGATLALLFCAVTVGGWTMLEPGSRLRRAWIAAAVVLVAYGAITAAGTLSLSSLRTTLAEHEDFHEGLASALHDPRVAAAVRSCGLVSLPDNKLIPDAEWILGAYSQRDIVARSQARDEAEAGRPALERRLHARSVAIYPLGSAVFEEAIVDVGDSALDQVPLAGFARLFTSRYYAVYADC